MIALVVLAVAALAANLAAGHARFVAQFVNADALWTLAFFKDVIEQGGTSPIGTSVNTPTSFPTGCSPSPPISSRRTTRIGFSPMPR